jgi:predicted secreted protein
MALKYFESGFLVLANNTTSGKQILKLTDVSLTYNVDTDETTSFDNSYSKTYEPTYMSWTVSCSGMITDDSADINTDAAVTGSTNGLLLLEQAKLRTGTKIIMKIDSSNYQKGDVIITSYDLKAAVGSKMTFSLNLQGSGALTKAAT